MAEGSAAGLAGCPVAVRLAARFAVHGFLGEVGMLKVSTETAETFVSVVDGDGMARDVVARMVMAEAIRSLLQASDLAVFVICDETEVQ
jgi:hypothetical protein